MANNRKSTNSPSNPNSPPSSGGASVSPTGAPGASQGLVNKTQQADEAPKGPGPGESIQDNAGQQGNVATLQRTDVIQVPTPRGPNAPLIGGPSTTIVNSEAKLELDYVASMGPALPSQFTAPFGTFQGAGIHVLPNYIDELERDWDINMYIRMMYDAVVKSAVNTLIDGILDKELQINSPYSGDKAVDVDARWVKFAKNIADFVRANLALPELRFRIASREWLEAIPMGYKLLEQTYTPREIIRGNGPQTVLTSLRGIPQEAASIVADRYNTVLGYLPRIPGTGLSMSFLYGQLGTPLITEGDESKPTRIEIPDMIPPEKLARLTWGMRNNNPQGVSQLRAAYVAWRLKIGLWPAFEAYLARFAQPSAALELNGVDTFAPMAGADGRILKSPTDIINQLLINLRNFQAGGAMVLPVGKLNLLQASGGGQAYLSAFEMVNNEITQSILYSTLPSNQSKYGTQALGEVQQDTANLPVMLGKMLYVEGVLNEIVKPLVLYNYGPDGLLCLPELSLGDTQQQDFATTSTAAASLKTANLLFPMQYNDIYKKLGLQPLPSEIIDMLQQLMIQQLTQPQPAVGPDGQPAQPGDPQAGAGGQGANGASGGANGPQNGSQSQSGQGSSGASGPQPQADSKYW